MHDEEHALLFARGDAAGAAVRARAHAVRGRARRPRGSRGRLTALRLFRLGPYLDEQERFVLDALTLGR